MRGADGPVSAALAQLSELPGWLVHLLLGAGAFLENVVPPVPADTFIGAGGLLAASGTIDPVLGFMIVWAANVAGALWVWWLGTRHGEAVFDTRIGRILLDDGQLRRLSAFYERRGTVAIFLARFVPAFRALVPAFAGVAGHSFARTAVPLLTASLIWYGAIFGAGWWAGENVAAIDRLIGEVNRTLWIVAGVAVAAVAVVWWRTRGRPAPEHGDEGDRATTGTGPDDADRSP